VLGLLGMFHDVAGDRSFFLSVTQTRGPHTHTDVTFWFVLAASRHQQFQPDPGEFTAVHWLSLENTDWTAERFDPHMARFATKLIAALDA
jgi:hypothetical protein